MYNGYITRLKNVRKHSNADRLQIATCFGNNVVVGLDAYEGELVCYFPTDGQLSEEYCKANNLLINKDENGVNTGGYLEPNKRNIRTMKLRGEISDGLVLGLHSLEKFTDITKFKEGDIIDVINGVEICRKYVPISNGRVVKDKNIARLGAKKEKKERFPIFHEHIDTSQLAYNLGYFKEGMVCYKTLKIHGTSARLSNTLILTNTQLKGIKKLVAKILKKPTVVESREWKTVSGTRRVILDRFDGGYYGSNNFRQKYHDLLDGKLHKGENIYFEICGYESSGKLIMPSQSNDKVNDKEFSKRYGKTTTFSYGCQNGENKAFIYRMSMTNEQGVEIDYPWDLVKLRAEQLGFETVPEIERFIYTTQEDLLERMNKDLDEPDPIGLTHVREGYVVRVEGTEKFKAFKHKSNYFKILEGIIKDSGISDMEEQESLESGE